MKTVSGRSSFCRKRIGADFIRGCLGDAAFDGLRAAIFEMYAAMVENDSRDGAEHQRRAHALEGIDEILEWRPLASFSARHLELLELLFAYWREAEVEGEVRAPSPDPTQ